MGLVEPFRYGFNRVLLQYIDYSLRLSQDAQTNGYVGALKTHAETKMGFLHAFYGASSISPLRFIFSLIL